MAKPAKKAAARGAGRPTIYRPEFVKQVAKLCDLGATEAEIAGFFGVNVATIWRWKTVHPEFCKAIKVAKEAADDRVERSLYNRAVGYTFPSEKIVTVSRGANMGSEIERVKIKEHVPPDVAAAIFWLKNRRKDQWRDKIDTEITGKDGGPIQTADMTDYEKARQIAFALKVAHRGKDKADAKV